MKRWLRSLAAQAFPGRFRPPTPIGRRALSVDGTTVGLDFDDPIHRRIWRQGGFEAEVEKALLQLSEDGDVVVDIGAHNGWHSLRLLQRRPALRQLYAYEPAATTFELLRWGVEALPPKLRQRTEIHHLALGAESGRLKLKIFRDLGTMHASLHPLADWEYDEEEVEVATLDDLAADYPAPPAVIKCDVEGAEREVLAGASGLMTGPTPPLWLLEANYETTGMAGYFPWQLLDDAARFAPYQAYVLRQGGVCPLPHQRALRHGDTLILAIPEHHQQRLQRAGTP
ncbi:MAG: FkbM family methyltransferase [Acidobacteriota bacterium]